jgi:immune inhibitor A
MLSKLIGEMLLEIESRIGELAMKEKRVEPLHDPMSEQGNRFKPSDWDYAYLVISTDGGSTWTSVATNLSTTSNPNGQNFGYGITGNSGGWVALTADLSAFTGDVLIGFRYWTDVNTVEPGFMVDDIQANGYPLDDAESDAGWTFDGFRWTTGSESAFYNTYYVAEFRQYRGYDEGLATAYSFGWSGDPVLYNWVEHFPYQDGLLISYWDTSFANNNVGANCAASRCGGLLLPIDAHPDIMYRADGGIWRNRIQSYDSTFSLEPTDSISLHWKGDIPPTTLYISAPHLYCDIYLFDGFRLNQYIS